jgi:integrase
VLWSSGPADKAGSTVTFRVCYYVKGRPGKPQYLKLGRYTPTSDLKAIRRKASQIRNEAQEGTDPRRPTLSGNLATMVDRFIAEYVSKKRSAEEMKRILTRYVVPEWADKNIEEITRADISELMFKIEQGKIKGTDGKKKLGTRYVATSVFAQISSLFTWYTKKYSSNDYINPIVRRMREKDDKPKQRERTLTDDEIRALWLACDDEPIYGALVKCALLTAQRFQTVGAMLRSDIKARFTIPNTDRHVDCVWDPTRKDDPDNKRKSAVPLSALALKIINAVPTIETDTGASDVVFTVNGTHPISGYSQMKERLDDRMLALLREWKGEDYELESWQQRDLRRTARTLMSRVGVGVDIAEHCLGHVLPTIRRTYDRYDYLVEKREAFEKLAALVERIVNPDPTNVVKLVDQGGKVKALR